MGTTFDDTTLFADLVEYEPTRMDASEKSISELNEIAGGDYWKPNFVDRIIFGRMNYNKVVTAYSDHKHFFNTCATEVIAYCDKLGIDYHIKNGTITPQCDTK